ncbi:hypothetical protein D3C81_428260 [compost metagenome]
MAFWHFRKKNTEVLTSEQTHNIVKILLAGIDLGYGQIKILCDGEKKKFLSTVGTPVSNFGRTVATVTEQEVLNSLAITLDDQIYYIGRNAVVNTRNGRLTLRQGKADNVHNKVKFLTALALYTEMYQTEAEFDIVTGLPVLEFKHEADALTKMMLNDGKPFEFDMHYGNVTVKKKINIGNVKIVSQGEGAFYDFVLNNNGEIIPERAEIVQGTVMVVDIGYRTTDIVTMENGSYVELLSDQFNKGVNTIHQEILRLIMEEFGIKKELRDLDEIVRKRSFMHNTKIYDIDHIITKAAIPFTEDIIENLHTISNDQLGAVNHIIFTGGGAEIVYLFTERLLKNVVESSLMEDAEFCNATGYHKYGLLLQKAQLQAEADADA